MEQSKIQKDLKTEALKYKHLNPGVNPIMVSLERRVSGVSPNSPKVTDIIDGHRHVWGSSPSSTHINFMAPLEAMERENFLNAGEQTYVISTLDNLDKFSEGYYDCTGLVVVGLSKEDGKNISFLSHQNPKSFLYEEKESFKKHLEAILIEIKERCVEGTIDSVLLGGQTFSVHREDYLSSIDLISKEVSNILGFEPVIVNGPTKILRWSDNIYFDNENRRVYFLRAEINEDIL